MHRIILPLQEHHEKGLFWVLLVSGLILSALLERSISQTLKIVGLDLSQFYLQRLTCSHDTSVISPEKYPFAPGTAIPKSTDQNTPRFL